MYCSNCGKEIDDEAMYCKYCGFRMKENSVSDFAQNDVKPQFNEQPQNRNLITGIITLICLIVLPYFVFSPIKFDIPILGASLEATISYDFLLQKAKFRVGAFGFDRDNVSPTDYINIKMNVIKHVLFNTDISPNITETISKQSQTPTRNNSLSQNKTYLPTGKTNNDTVNDYAHSKNITADTQMPLKKDNSSLYNEKAKTHEALGSNTPIPTNEKSTNKYSTDRRPTLTPIDSNSRYMNSLERSDSNEALGMDTIQEPDFGPYMRELQRRIKQNWDPPKGDQSKRVVLLFKIDKEGNLLSCSVQKSSGISSIDKAAVQAVQLTAPFKPLPREFKGSSVDIQFTFDYNVFGATGYH